MATRIHQLAKALGVKSTAIVDKCQAEGLTAVKGHQSTVSAGLEATIREWFSNTNTHNTVETTAKVDLEKVKTKPDRSDASTDIDLEMATDEAPVAPVATMITETPVSEMPPKVDDHLVTVELGGREKPHRISPAEMQKQEQEIITAPAPEQEPAPISEPAVPETEIAALTTPNIEEAPETAEPARPRPVPVPVKHPPVKESVKPVQYIPKPAVLEGPKVIRTERPDFVPVPTPRPPRRERVVQIDQAAAETTPAKSVKGSKKAKKTRSVTLEDVTETDAKRKSRLTNKRQKRVDISTSYGDRDLQERQERLASASGRSLHRRERMAGKDLYSLAAQQKAITEVTLKEPITVKDLSAAIGVRVNEIIAKLMAHGIMANVNQSLDTEAAETLGLEYDIEIRIEKKKLRFDELKEQFDSLTQDSERHSRPPVVAFLGHVDHGKTSLLDQIRRAKVASGEAGGITQHIGSYLYDDGKRRVTFLDTPGHKAFTEMRARGANMTDIVVLVVAADDGVMPQTEEAINHARAANVPIVVALNKVDLPNADINRALGQLSEKGLIPTEWGGDTEIVQTSAATGQGIDELVEYLDYVAELNNLKARQTGPASGWIVEAEMSTARGALARLLVKSGSLKPGDAVVSGACYGRIRTIHDAYGAILQEAGPSTPIEVTGLNAVPTAGDPFYVVSDISEAAQIANEHEQNMRENTLARRRQITLDNLFSEIAAGEVRELNVIVKADVQGSIDVLRNSILELNTSEVAVKILHTAVGGISENDVVLAAASNAIIIGFQVVADDRAREMAERNKVEIRLYRVIYKITDDLKLALEGMLAPKIEEKSKGRAEVRKTFKVSRVGTIAGCFVNDGVINRHDKVRIVRDGVIIRDGNDIQTLKRHKDDTNEVRSGFECGIKLAGFDDIKEGDIIEAYEYIEISRTLESSSKTTN